MAPPARKIFKKPALNKFFNTVLKKAASCDEITKGNLIALYKKQLNANPVISVLYVILVIIYKNEEEGTSNCPNAMQALSLFNQIMNNQLVNKNFTIDPKTFETVYKNIENNDNLKRYVG